MVGGGPAVMKVRAIMKTAATDEGSRCSSQEIAMLHAKRGKLSRPWPKVMPFFGLEVDGLGQDLCSV